MKKVLIASALSWLALGWGCGGDASDDRSLTNPVMPPDGGASGGASGGLAGSAAGTSAGSRGLAGAPGVTMPVPPAAGSGGVAAPGGTGARAGRGGAMSQAGRAGSAGMPAPIAGSSAMPASGDRSPEAVCARWKADRADLSEGTWSGSVATCEVGDISENGRANALRVLNLYRWLADLPAVTTDPTMDRQAQACALIQRANNKLSHTPPTSATCYSAEGAMASGRCNISSGPGVTSVDGYMVDPGNPMTIGHRRWILSNSFGPTGLGSTDKHSCMMTAGKMKVGRAWQAWPAPGVMPVQVMSGPYGSKVDATGWTVQSDTINLQMAQVSVTSEGTAMPVTVTPLSGGYGSRYALRFNPMGWSSTAGKTYDVSVSGAAMPIQYSVQFVDCK